MKDIINKGLTSKEVLEEQAKGNVNQYEDKATKTNGQIIKENVFTLFNLLNFLLAVALVVVGSYSNTFFIFIIILNIIIGIVQEIRARNMVEKLSILAHDKVTVFRDNHSTQIETTELVLNDLVVLNAGEQVPSDMIILSGQGDVNEALLTGESDAIHKTIDDHLLSGSFLTSGQLYGRVEHVGASNYAARLVEEAKVAKPISSELLEAIRKISRFTSIVIIPLGILLFIEAFLLRSNPANAAVTSSVAALIGMLPKGLALLISIALATAVINLAKKQILVQNMYAVETFSHMDVICLDKTGTITEGRMKVEGTYVLDKAFDTTIQDILGSYLESTTDNNLTMKALRDAYPTSTIYKMTDFLTFSSERKWGAVEFGEFGTVYLGSPENLFPNQTISPLIQEYQNDGLRVLVIGHSPNKLSKETPMNTFPIALITLSDPIRENAEETLAFLKKQGIDLKIISGDNPKTVSSIAKQAGFDNYDHYIDLSTLKSDDEIKSVLDNYSILGRVSPQQKQLIVRTLKAEQHVVGMTGDGVNDILALKEADISIAMAEGDGATKQISDIVLLDSDFSALPHVVYEGRRVINNVTRSSSVFFIKTIYSFLMSLVCLIGNIAFPFIPIQITLIDLAIEGYPAFFSSFEPSKKKVTGHFLRTALSRALPSALLIVINFIVVKLFSQSLGFTTDVSNSLIYFLLVGISCIAVFKAYSPFSPLRIFLAITTTVGTFVAILLFHSILEVTLLSGTSLMMFIYMMVVNIVAFPLLYILITKIEKKRA